MWLATPARPPILPVHKRLFQKKKLVIYNVNFHHILILGVYLCLGYFAEIIEE